MRPFALAVIATLMTTTASPQTRPAPLPASNPFAKPSTLPYQAPPFDRIKDSDYQPAIEAGMAEQIAEIRRIADNTAAPTFDNTIVAMERSGQLLERAGNAFNGVTGANTNDTLQAAEAALAPKYAAHSDAINLDPKLFQRVKTLYDRRSALKLTPEQLRVLTNTYEDMVRAGAQLTPAQKVEMTRINAQLSTLSNTFNQRLLAATKAGGLVVDDQAKLAGLSDAEIAAAADAAKARGLTGKWVIPLQNTTQQPLLAKLTDRGTREALFNASWTRTTKGDANDTRAIIAEIAQLRAQKAKLLGFKTFADYRLQENMAKTPETASAFMRQLATPLAVEQKKEAAELQAQIKAEGGNFALKPWDWDF